MVASQTRGRRALAPANTDPDTPPADTLYKKTYSEAATPATETKTPSGFWDPGDADDDAKQSRSSLDSADSFAEAAAEVLKEQVADPDWWGEEEATPVEPEEASEAEEDEPPAAVTSRRASVSFASPTPKSSVASSVGSLVPPSDREGEWERFVRVASQKLDTALSHAPPAARRAVSVAEDATGLDALYLAFALLALFPLVGYGAYAAWRTVFVFGVSIGWPLIGAARLLAAEAPPTAELKNLLAYFVLASASLYLKAMVGVSLLPPFFPVKFAVYFFLVSPDLRGSYVLFDAFLKPTVLACLSPKETCTALIKTATKVKKRMSKRMSMAFSPYSP